MGHLAHLQTLLPLWSCFLPLFLERMFVQNTSYEHDFIFKRMNAQVISIFLRIVLHKDSFCHRGKNQLFIYELAQGAFDSVINFNISSCEKNVLTLYLLIVVSKKTYISPHLLGLPIRNRLSNMSNYSSILIGFDLWSIGGQTHR